MTREIVIPLPDPDEVVPGNSGSTAYRDIAAIGLLPNRPRHLACVEALTACVHLVVEQPG